MKELDPTKPVQLRDGRQVKNICWDYRFVDGTIGIAAIIRDKDSDYWIAWDTFGRYYHSSTSLSRLRDGLYIPVTMLTVILLQSSQLRK